jgi:hypothetical protein
MIEVEIISITAKKAQSQDKIYRVVLETNDQRVLQLEQAIAEETVKLTFEGVE